MLEPSARHWAGQESRLVVRDSGLQAPGSLRMRGLHLQAPHMLGPHLCGFHTEHGCQYSRTEGLVLESCPRGYVAPEQAEAAAKI